MKILSAVDGSDAAFQAFQSACRIAQKTFSSVVTFYVNTGEEYNTDQTGWISLTEKVADELETLGHEIIQRTYAIGRKFGISIEGIMSYGLPASEIVNYVNAHGIIKLISMGHSSTGRAQEFAESTTRAVISASTIPVFVSSAEVDVKRVLIAVDNSETAKRVAAFGGRLAKSLDAELAVVAFVPDIEAMIGEYRLIAEVPNMEKHIAASERDLKKILNDAVEAARKTLKPLGIPDSRIVKVGHADELISEAARCDALVLGINGRSSGRIGRIGNKLLEAHSINTFFVQ